MNDKLIEKLIDWIENLQSIGAQQLPKFASEIVTYGMVKNGLFVLIFLCLGVVSSVILENAYPSMVLR